MKKMLKTTIVVFALSLALYSCDTTSTDEVVVTDTVDTTCVDVDTVCVTTDSLVVDSL